eukprot:scaffold49693_cov32-Tisochrysis_lutea.AAC.3
MGRPHHPKALVPDCGHEALSQHNLRSAHRARELHHTRVLRLGLHFGCGNQPVLLRKLDLRHRCRVKLRWRAPRWSAVPLALVRTSRLTLLLRLCWQSLRSIASGSMRCRKVKWWAMTSRVPHDRVRGAPPRPKPSCSSWASSTASLGGSSSSSPPSCPGSC